MQRNRAESYSWIRKTEAILYACWLLKIEAFKVEDMKDLSVK